MSRKPVLLSFLLLALLLPLAARADEGDRGESGLKSRLIRTGFLTGGRTDQIRAAPPTILTSAERDENEPLFGGRPDEPVLCLGSIDELIELIKNAVRPAFWEQREGAYLRTSGEHLLVVRAEPEVLDEVSAFLGEQERRVGRMVTVEVHAVRLTRPEALALQRSGMQSEAVQTVLLSPRAGPSTSLTAFAGQRVAAFGGRQRAWLAGQEGQVSDEVAIGDPLVDVANLGLALDVVAIPVPDQDDVLVGLDASLSSLADTHDVDAGAAGTLEAPAYGVTEVRSAVVIRAGAWTLLDGAGAEGGEAGVYFLLRATPRELPSPANTPTGFDLPALPAAPADGLARESLVLRHHAVPALTTASRPAQGAGTYLLPSNFVPMEQPELPEPWPIVPAEGLVDLLREASGDAAWEDPTSIEARNRTLIVRHTPETQEGIARLLDALRERYLETFRVTAELVETGAELARAFEGGGVLDERSHQLLAEALGSGGAESRGVARVTSLAGSRNTVLAGRHVPYVHDYAADIAAEVAILDPKVALFLDGVELDVQVWPTAGGRSAHLALRYVSANPAGPMRTVSTGAGATLELPELEMRRVRCDLAVPFGRPVVVATWRHGPRWQVLLVKVDL